VKRVTLLAIVGVAVFASTSTADGKTRTTVTLDGIFAVPIETHWDGDLKSARKACKKRRKVQVFRVRPGADQKIGSTRSYKGKVDNGYYWSLVKDGIAPAGDYHAKVRPTDKCRGDRSPTLHFSAAP
jgi:hypothetical protein